MEQQTITKLITSFEECVYEQDGVEYWFARELQELLEYTQWRNLLNVVGKAKESCKNSGNEVDDHFADVSKLVKIPISAEVPHKLTWSQLYGLN